MKYFSDAEAGEKVWDFCYGDGVIKEVAGNIVKVEYKKGDDTTVVSYNLNGVPRNKFASRQTLFWGVVDYKPPRERLKDGELVWCWNKTWRYARHLRIYDARNDATFHPVHGTRGSASYDHMKKYRGKKPAWYIEAAATLGFEIEKEEAKDEETDNTDNGGTAGDAAGGGVENTSGADESGNGSGKLGGLIG